MRDELRNYCTKGQGLLVNYVWEFSVKCYGLPQKCNHAKSNVVTGCIV